MPRTGSRRPDEWKTQSPAVNIAKTSSVSVTYGAEESARRTVRSYEISAEALTASKPSVTWQQV